MQTLGKNAMRKMNMTVKQSALSEPMKAVSTQPQRVNLKTVVKGACVSSPKAAP